MLAPTTNPIFEIPVAPDVSPTFVERVDRILSSTDSLLCVGLDPDPERIPPSVPGASRPKKLARFLSGIIEETRPHAAAFKFQLGAYWNYGPEGFRVLADAVDAIGPRRLRILDLKANDVPYTMRLMRDGIFRQFAFDAITATPWMGWESFEPFQEDPEHGLLVVAHSSNPGAADFQEREVPGGALWEEVVRGVRRIGRKTGNAGVVVGATYPDAVRATRKALGPALPILLPGIGAQAGSLDASVRAGVDGRGRALLVAASRSVLFAAHGADWARAAAAEARRLREQINSVRRGPRTGPRARS